MARPARTAVAMMQRLPQYTRSRAAQPVHAPARHERGIGIGWALMMACAVAVAPDGAAQAQVVERNLPPEPPRRASAIKLGTDDLLTSDDATPLGVNVQGIVLIGADANARPAAGAKGIDVSQVSGIDAPGLREQLTPFLDRPLSRKLIAEVQAKLAAAYREAGRPFVSITLPPQEVSTGVLQLRVIAFKVAGIKVTGAERESFPQERIRLVPGQEIDARKLETDLDWANRNPFRQVEAVFGPGKDLGMTDVNIQVTPGYNMFFDWQGMILFQPNLRFVRDPWRFIVDYTTINSGVFRFPLGFVRDRSNVRFQVEYVL